MRRIALAILIVAASAAAGPVPAQGSPIVGAPLTHGPDPQAIDAPATKARAAKALPATWCGTAQPHDDTTHELDNGAHRYHAVYMVAADAPDRFSQIATTLQRDAFQASALLERTYGRAIRFDLGTSCGPQYLDISVVRMPQTQAEMAARARQTNGTFDAVTSALRQAGMQPISPTDNVHDAATLTRNYVVWVDAPTAPGTCGEAAIYDDPTRSSANLNNLGGKVALVFRNGDAFCSSNAVRHEIAHNLGALQPLAPHAFDGAHCNDAYEDTMCYSNAPKVADAQRGLFFDYGNDDYWSPPNGAPLPWWTVDQSSFLCPDASCNLVEGTGDPASGDPAAGGPAPAAPTGDGDGTDTGEDADVTSSRSTHRRSRGRVRIRASRRGRRLWKLRVSASGDGRGIVVVRCRRRHRGQVRTVLARRTALPRRFGARVRCGASRPRARLLLQQ